MEQYEAIVIGAGIAGLSVAGILQTKGIKTLVIEKSKTPGGRAKTYEAPGGWRLDSGTHAMNLGLLSPANKILKRLGGEINWSRPIEGGMVFNEGKWMTFEENMSLNGEDLKEYDSINDRISRITDEEIAEQDTVPLSDWTRDNIANPRIIEYFNNMGMVQTTLAEAHLISAGEFLHIYRNTINIGLEDQGMVRMPVGGIGAFTGALADRVKELGGTITFKQAVRRIKFGENGIKTVVTDSGEYFTSTLVMAMPIWDLVKVLDMDEEDSPLPKEWRERMKSLVEETSSAIGFTLLLNKELFKKPVYLANWRIPGVNLPMQIFFPTNFDDTLAPPGHMIAFIGACLTIEQVKDKKFCQEKLEAFWKACQEMFPGLEDTIIYRGDETTIGIDGLSRSPGLTGRYRPKVYMPELPGLYFAGDCFTGRGVGMESASNSAIICTEKILEDLGK
ncbi:MAG: NAD(P)/FAD-dependent oxidoreductase [Deltaproteobacteria bacterium]|nr:NAD(P)/FAD-dependent oxidoreductase [Deltaproteobacteria bacterium]MBW1848885.1 NAD(P)/FAD-dependent oxidoreductase [Deltaproteobacteria bacterium]